MARRNSVSLWIIGLLFGLTTGLALSAAPVFAQQAPDTTIAAALGSLGSRAGVVFGGEVTAIRHIDGVVEIDFQVNQNVKAANAGEYTLREWSGLWAAGQRRYWVGERAVVFLNSAGKSGLSSSVDGMEGILPIVPDATNALVVDVQRLRTRVLRAAGQPMVNSAAQMSFAEVAAAVIPQPAGPPVVDPTVPVRAPFKPPVLRPIQNPIVAEFPNQAVAAPQNSVVLVMGPDQTDDVLFTDDADSKDKKADSLDASH